MLSGRPSLIPVCGAINKVPWFNSHVMNPVRDTWATMSLTFLGTAATMPGPWRNVSSSVVRVGGSALMFDCGEGTMRQLSVTHVVSRGEIDHIFITHMHGDHVYGLPGLLSTLLSRFLSECATKSQQPLRLYGPRGLSMFLRQHFAGDASSSVENDAVRRFHVIELLNGRQKPSVPPTATSYFGTFGYQVPDADGKHTLLDTPDFRVVAAPIQHAVPCFGYVVHEKDKPGAIDAEKVTALGLPPGPAYRKLKEGSVIVLPNGTVIRPEDVVGPPCVGRKVVVLGDTRNPDGIGRFAEDADLLVHEATFVPGLSDAAKACGHSTPEMAGEFARAIRAKRLVLTHLSNSELAGYGEASINALNSPEVTEPIRSTSAIVPRARTPFPITLDSSLARSHVDAARKAGQINNVLAARDFMTIVVPTRSGGPQCVEE